MRLRSLAGGVFGAAVVALLINSPSATASDSAEAVLSRAFDLGGERSQVAQYYTMESKLMTHLPDGTLQGTDVFRLALEYLPAGLSGGEAPVITCLYFTVQLADSPEVAIPDLENWSYDLDTTGMDEEGQVFGIDHSGFESVVDAGGKALPPHLTYHVYNAFVDFHSFCDIFARPMTDGKGIQDLSRIGDIIVHEAAFSEPPVNLGSNVMEGSYFRNGRITLEFKGLSLVNGRQCALLEYDSGQSSFRMKMQPMPDLEVETAGSSHYRGDIHKDLESNWVQKATLSEWVVSETTLPMPPGKLNSVNERSILILNVDKDRNITD
jgi:hypothetical protein